MNHSFQLSADTGVLSLAGALTIEHGAELKASLSGALEAADHIVCDLSGLESADICTLQLFCSAHKAAARAGKTLEFRATCEGFDASVMEAGFRRHVGCMSQNSADCLWIEGPGEKTEVAP